MNEHGIVIKSQEGFSESQEAKVPELEHEDKGS
jgi:hypothetical protein